MTKRILSGICTVVMLIGACFSVLAENIPPENRMIQRMVVWRYNTLGTEGLSSENYSGVSYSYKGDYPDDIMQILRSYKKVRVVGND